MKVDSSGFLTLVAVILAALSLLSRGRKVTYLHKFGWPHFLLFIVSVFVILSCLFYDFLKEMGWLLPYTFLPGFDEEKLVLATSIVILLSFLLTVNFGQTMKHRANSLFKSINELLVNGAFGDLSYVLESNIEFFEKTKIREMKSTETTIKKLILSEGFLCFLEGHNYSLLNRIFRMYPDSDVSIIKFNEFISAQLLSRKTSLMWEAAFLFQSYSPRIPNDDTPLLTSLYTDENKNFKYSFYEQLGLAFESFLKNEETIIKLNESPSNVQTDHFINDSLPTLYIFLFSNLLKYDLCKGSIIRRDQGTVRTPWIFYHKFIRNMVDYREFEGQSENEFKTRIDYYLFESFRNYNDLLDVDSLFTVDGYELSDLIECIASSFYYVFNCGKFDREFSEHILAFAISIFSKINDSNKGLSRKFATLCTHQYEGAVRTVITETENFEVLKNRGAREFINLSME
ncbi:hypothetical protein BOO29_14115 [Vibrio navarrensis]|nr:hypothetical protein [Vibrio navarrensis]MBE4607518.1 hypothetical protein [Vibrio navarrensis]MBE4611837.1 hypothetical protein [Vibrio navarrensis]